MGATARAAHDAGGKVLGVIPHFLTSHERPLTTVETVIVNSMHERKMMMFEAGATPSPSCPAASARWRR